MVVRGEPLAGVDGYAGEFGQNRPGLASPADRVTEHGTVEDEVSRSRLLGMLGLAASDEAELDAAIAGASGAPLRAELARQQRVLAVALANAVNVLNPRLVVLGGYLASLHAWDPAALEAAVAEAAIPAAMEDAAIVPAGLGQDRLLIGAAELALAGLLADPVAV